MLQHEALRWVAAAAAAAHVYFAYRETQTWGRGFVAAVAPGWLAKEPPVTDGQIAWAGDLAFNMGVYNLMLAAGLAWVAYGGAALASLGAFFGIWLLVAAGAAWRTGVVKAFHAQGVLGLLLLGAALWAGQAAGAAPGGMR